MKEKTPQQIYRTNDGCTFDDAEEAIDQAIDIQSEALLLLIKEEDRTCTKSSDDIWENKVEIITACQRMISVLKNPNKHVTTYTK